MTGGQDWVAEMIDASDNGGYAMSEAKDSTDYRDCLDVASKIADAVACYDSDDLLEVITPHLEPLIGELDAAEAECERLRKELDDSRTALRLWLGNVRYALDASEDHLTVTLIVLRNELIRELEATES